MIKCLKCVAIGLVVGMALYAIGVHGPIPLIVVGVTSGVMATGERR